jgi:hypothetical protein
MVMGMPSQGQKTTFALEKQRDNVLGSKVFLKLKHLLTSLFCNSLK